MAVDVDKLLPLPVSPGFVSCEKLTSGLGAKLELLIGAAGGGRGAGVIRGARVVELPPLWIAATFWHSPQRFADFDKRQAFLISNSVVLTQPGY